MVEDSKKRAEDAERGWEAEKEKILTQFVQMTEQRATVASELRHGQERREEAESRLKAEQGERLRA